MLEFQELSSVLKTGFALSKWPHLHRAYLVTVPEYLSQSVTASLETSIISYVWVKLTISINDDDRFLRWNLLKMAIVELLAAHSITWNGSLLVTLKQDASLARFLTPNLAFKKLIKYVYVTHRFSYMRQLSCDPFLTWPGLGRVQVLGGKKS